MTCPPHAPPIDARNVQPAAWPGPIPGDLLPPRAKFPAMDARPSRPTDARPRPGDAAQPAGEDALDAREPAPAGGFVPDASEAALLEGLRRGDDAAYEQLVRTHTGPLLAVARRFLRSEDDARDAVQEAFIAAFRSLDRFEGHAKISTWLHRIVVNTALMKLRSRRRRPEESIEPLLPKFKEDGHQVEPVAAWRGTPEALLQEREARDLVRARIDELPENYREILLMRDIEQMSGAEVASALGITVNAVKIRLHRARQALRGLLAPHFREVAR